jgi:hypothetical protein
MLGRSSTGEEAMADRRDDVFVQQYRHFTIAQLIALWGWFGFWFPLLAGYANKRISELKREAAAIEEKLWPQQEEARV